MLANSLISTSRKIRFGLVVTIAALLIAFSPNLYAQSPLTVQPSTGRVGVGNTNPTETVDVTGTVKATTFKGDGSQLTNLPQASQWTTSGSNIYYNATNGKVGVGTTNPGAALEVSGELRLGNPGTGAWFKSNVDNQVIAIGGGTNGFGSGVIVVRGSGQSYNPAGIEIYAGGGAFVFDNGGNLSMSGTLTAAAKNFTIDHPLAPNTKQLVHSSLEGPEVAVYYRGEAQLKQGEATVKLPHYFEALIRQEQRTVQLTAIDGWAPLYVSGGVKQGTFRVRTNATGDQVQRFYWEVKAVRADIPLLVVEKPKDLRTTKLADKPVNAEPFVGLPR